jgi:formylglycine-generating enzyme required for sulfatase activity
MGIPSRSDIFIRSKCLGFWALSLFACAAIAAWRIGGAAPVAAQAKTKVNPHDGLTYVLVTAGTFQMGCSPDDSNCKDDEKPAHSVTLTKDFWIGETPVTQAAYKKVMKGANPSIHKGDQMPVTFITWSDADAYCKAVEMRLPTEAEYEYAARGGSAAARYGPIADIAWYFVNSGGLQARDVKLKQPNAYGLYDMMGNVWEWTADWYGPYSAAGAVDPTGPPNGTERAERGGSWFTGPLTIRASTRDYHLSVYRYTDVGVRCAGT